MTWGDQLWQFFQSQLVHVNFKNEPNVAQDAKIGIDLSVATAKDSLQDDGHAVILAAFSRVVASTPEADMIILSEWSNSDYTLLLDLVYGGSGRLGSKFEPCD